MGELCYAGGSQACRNSEQAFTPELTGRENIFLNGAILANVRLAFSVVTRLECDVLVVDEVLAVGDHRSRAEVPGQEMPVRSLRSHMSVHP